MKRNPNIDLLKTISIILVILVHSLPRNIQMLIGRPLLLQHAVPVFMVLFGYNRMKSIERKGPRQLADLYNWDYIWKQLKSIVIPYFFIWITIELTFGLYLKQNLMGLMQSFVLGGRGPGGYFIVLMIQAILLFPLLYYVLNKVHPIKALTGIFLVNLLLEALSANMNPDLYRIIIVRHVFTIALGIYLAKYEETISIKKWIPFVTLSLVYIISVDYGDAHFAIEHMWDSQHPPAYFWTFFLVYFGLKLPFKENQFVTLIGKSSYHIFLIQKVYFMFRNAFFPDISYGTDTVISILISLGLGIGFYYLVKNNYFINTDTRKLSMETNRRKES